MKGKTVTEPMEDEVGHSDSQGEGYFLMETENRGQGVSM